MLSTAARSRLAIVLVGARNPANIGAAARALHDFGFSDLRIANDFAPPLEAAQLEAAQSATRSAVSAQHILSSARRFDTLLEAIADCTFVAGTTAIGERELTQPILSLQQAAPIILAELGADTKLDNPSPRVALLFGSEKTGLTNDHLSHCSLLTTIPLFEPGAAATEEKYPRHLSMNLAQSVAVCLYELTRSGFEGARELPALHEAPATGQDRELLTQLLLEVMQTSGYTRRYPHNAAPTFVRRLVQQLGCTHREAMTWMGILRQLLFRASEEPPK